VGLHTKFSALRTYLHQKKTRASLVEWYQSLLDNL
jgi:hypothetical protein